MSFLSQGEREDQGVYQNLTTSSVIVAIGCRKENILWDPSIIKARLNISLKKGRLYIETHLYFPCWLVALVQRVYIELTTQHISVKISSDGQGSKEVILFFTLIATKTNVDLAEP